MSFIIKLKAENYFLMSTDVTGQNFKFVAISAKISSGRVCPKTLINASTFFISSRAEFCIAQLHLILVFTCTCIYTCWVIYNTPDTYTRTRNYWNKHCQWKSTKMYNYGTKIEIRYANMQMHIIRRLISSISATLNDYF